MWDFALVSVSSAMVLSGETIQNVRLVVNGVAARPWRLTAVEALVKGRPRNEETATAAGELASKKDARVAELQQMLEGYTKAAPGEAIAKQ